MTDIFKYLLKNLKKQGPMYGLLIILLLVAFFHLQAQVEQKADKDTIEQLIHQNNEYQVKMERDFGELKGEIKGLAKYFTGQSSFNGKVQKYPPPQYIVAADFIIPEKGYDSCLCGVITNSKSERMSWYCYQTDSSGLQITEFK